MPTLNPALRNFWQQKARNKVLHGGRASSKSWDAAGFVVYLAQKYRIRVLCARQFQNRISDSVYSLLKIQIHRFGLQEEFNILENRILHKKTGSEFVFYGLWRHIEEIKSLEGIDICWLEEAHALTEQQWKILNPTIRKQGSEIWIIFNPKFVTDFVWKRFVVDPPVNTIVRQINYLENPFLSDTMLEVIEDAKTEDKEQFEHIYLGQPLSDDDCAVIKRTWIMAAIDAHLKLNIEDPTLGGDRIGFDIADSGADANAIVLRKGSLAMDADEWKGGEDQMFQSCEKVWGYALRKKATVVYDSIGVGAGTGSNFNKMNQIGKTVRAVGFNAGAAVHKPDTFYANGIRNKDQFANLKAQAWWMVADRFRNTYNAVHNGHEHPVERLIFIDSKMPHLMKLVDELCTPRRDFDENGRVKVESKKDLARSSRVGGPIPSPNLADAFIMAFAPVRMPLTIHPDMVQTK